MYEQQLFSPLRTKAREKKLAAFDVETSDENLKFERGCLYDDDGYEIFTNPLEMVSKMFSKRYRGYTWCAHNLSYDLACILPYIPNQLRAFFIDSRMFKADYSDGNKHAWHFLDSWGLSSYLSLASLGKSLNMPKYDTPPQYLGEDVEVPEWKCDKHNKTWCGDCYVSRDCAICLHYMELFQDWLLQHRCSLGNTAPSTAMQFYRRNYLDVDYYTPFPVRNDFARQAYYGGRVEAFKLGRWNNVNLYDINSLYPHCMYAFEYPHPNYLIGPTVDTKESIIWDYEGVSTVTIDIPKTYIGPLPVRDGVRVIFPVGTVKGTWSHVEIRNAIANGCRITSVIESLYSRETCRPFERYVSDIYQQRLDYKANGDSREQVCKLLLNSLYGKFGQRSDSGIQTIKSIREMPNGVIPNGAIVDVIDGTVYLRESVPSWGQPAYLNTLWASYITSYARITLYNYLKELGHENYYCDTDSIFTTRTLPTSSELGALKLVHSDVDYVGYGLKMYQLYRNDIELDTKVKGIPRRYQAKFLEEGFVTYQRSLGWKEGISRHIGPNRWRPITKHIRSPEPKRVYYSLKATPEMRQDSFPIRFHQ